MNQALVEKDVYAVTFEQVKVKHHPVAGHYHPVTSFKDQARKDKAPVHPLWREWQTAWVLKRKRPYDEAELGDSFRDLPQSEQNAISVQLDSMLKERERAEKAAQRNREKDAQEAEKAEKAAQRNREKDAQEAEKAEKAAQRKREKDAQEAEKAEKAAQREREKAEVLNKASGLSNAPFKMLGYDQGSYYFWSAETMQVIPMTGKDLITKNLTMLAPLSFWSTNYPAFNAYGEQKVEGEWIVAGDEIMREQAKAGVYETGTVRGRGYWREGERIIHHNGDEVRCVRTGETIPLLSNELEFLYQRTASKPYSKDEATKFEINKLREIISSIFWEDRTTGSVLFLGWLAGAQFCGMLPWRSHLWVTAPRGAGKSDTLCRIASVVLPDALYVKGETSEPGIRQELRSNATPLIGDEMEPNTAKDQARVDRVISLTRNASSDDDAQTLKGSASGAAIAYGGKTMALMTSINCRITNGADASRFAVLGVKLMPKTPDTTKAFNLIDDTCREFKKTNFGARLERFIANRIDDFINNINVAIEVVGSKMESGRSGDQYGVLIGAAITVIEGGGASKEKIESLVDEMDLQSTIVGEQDTSQDDGWSACWRRIAAIRLDFQDSNASVSVGEAIDWLATENVDEIISLAGGVKSKHQGSDENCLDKVLKVEGIRMIEKALGKLGIKYQHNAEQFADKAFYVDGSARGIYLARKNETLSSHLKGSTFEDWTQYAKRAAVGYTQVMIKFAGVSTRAEFIPID